MNHWSWISDMTGVTGILQRCACGSGKGKETEENYRKITAGVDKDWAKAPIPV